MVDELPIVTASLLLRRFVPDDAARLFFLSNERTFREWLGSQVYADEAEARSVLQQLITQYTAPADPRAGAYVLAVEHKGAGLLMGHVGFSPIGEEVEIGFAIAEEFQGHGYASEAVAAACRWAFASFGLPRILAITAQANQASRRTLLRAEFDHQDDRLMKFQGAEQQVSVYSLEGFAAGHFQI